jgi:hypothetical protein
MQHFFSFRKARPYFAPDACPPSLPASDAEDGPQVLRYTVLVIETVQHFSLFSINTLLCPTGAGGTTAPPSRALADGPGENQGHEAPPRLARGV